MSSGKGLPEERGDILASAVLFAYPSLEGFDLSVASSSGYYLPLNNLEMLAILRTLFLNFFDATFEEVPPTDFCRFLYSASKSSSDSSTDLLFDFSQSYIGFLPGLGLSHSASCTGVGTVSLKPKGLCALSGEEPCALLLSTDHCLMPYRSFLSRSREPGDSGTISILVFLSEWPRCLLRPCIFYKRFRSTLAKSML